MKNSILTIDPGTRHWGVSVFHGEEIITCMVKNLSAKDSSENRLRETRKIFLGLCRNYSPDVLVIEKPYDFWESQSTYLGSIIREVKRLSKKEKIKVVEFSPGTIRKVICNDENATKQNIAEIICQFYPELKAYLDHNRKYKDKYWGHMSDSIGFGICYLMSQKKSNKV